MSLNFTVPFSQADAERLRNLSALEPLRRQFGWVLWRGTQNSKGKWDKPPFQIAKPTENAANNRPLTWGKFEDGLSVALRERMSGLGFCLHLNFACFDLDNCRNRETGAIAPWARELIEACARSITLGTNPWTGAPIIEREGCYCEITPSLTGLHIWGYGRLEKVEHKKILMPDGGKLETFRGTCRYVTVTGRVFEKYDGALKNLDPVIDAYQQAEAERQGPRPLRHERRAQGAGPVDVNQLRDGLSFIPADDREVWLHVGMACHTIGARDIWDDWSQTSDKYDEAGQDKAWTPLIRMAESRSGPSSRSPSKTAGARLLTSAPIAECAWRPLTPLPDQTHPFVRRNCKGMLRRSQRPRRNPKKNGKA